MEYSRENAKRKQEEDREELVKLYVSSKSWEEFKLAANFIFPNAKRSTMRAFWLYLAKKTHPVAYFGAWTLAFALLTVVGSFFIDVSPKEFSVLKYAISEACLAFPLLVLHIVLHDETMSLIARHEAESKG